MGWSCDSKQIFKKICILQVCFNTFAETLCLKQNRDLFSSFALIKFVLIVIHTYLNQTDDRLSIVFFSFLKAKYFVCHKWSILFSCSKHISDECKMLLQSIRQHLMTDRHQ